MNTADRYQITLLAVVVLVVQIFIPVINLSGLQMTPDILIIFMTYIGYYYGRTETIILGFLLGLIQDFVTQSELIGIMAFVKSLIGYGLGTMALYRSIWYGNIRTLFIFSIYFLHFFIYHFIKLNGTSISNLLFLKIILINTVICFFILLIIDKSIIKKLFQDKRSP